MTEKKTSKVANRLAQETSTYLLQHAYNPVDWYPWSEEALSRSKQEGKPILLSIGYAACHWCHVMEHESFEDVDTAKLMNEKFVNVKVDREERTDLDEIYMKAVQLMTGHGGWPMTVFLTPDLKPIFAGTYFPPTDKHGMPSFKKILNGVSRAWDEKREDVLKSAQEVTDHLVKFESLGDLKLPVDGSSSDEEFDVQSVESAFGIIHRYFDSQWGGIGTSPKFPQPFCLDLGLRILSSNVVSDSTKEKAKQFIDLTLEKMAIGGIHDHLAGGFARYSVDRKWLIPHFEKMLYDNALLCSIYFNAYRQSKNDYWKNVGAKIVEFVDNELTTEDGVFYSSLDADSEGKEGEFYVWTKEQIESCLDKDDAEFVLKVYGVTDSGNFEDGKSVLVLEKVPSQQSSDLSLTDEEFAKIDNRVKEQLLSERAKRIRPGLDEKVLTSWNCLMVSALVSGYKAVFDSSYLDKAKRACNFLLEKMISNDRVLRTYGKGKAKLNGYLDDYSYFVAALLDLKEVDSCPLWLDKAIELTDSMLENFWDEENGGFFYTANYHEELVVRTKSHFDGAVPSGASVAASNLLRLHKITGKEIYFEKAMTVLKIYSEVMVKRPEQFGNLLSTLLSYMTEAKEIVLVEPSSSSTSLDMLKAIFKDYRPADTIVVCDSETSNKSEYPLLSGRVAQDNSATVYVCENFACKEPVGDVVKLGSVL